VQLELEDRVLEFAELKDRYDEQSQELSQARASQQAIGDDGEWKIKHDILLAVNEELQSELKEWRATEIWDWRRRYDELVVEHEKAMSRKKAADRESASAEESWREGHEALEEESWRERHGRVLFETEQDRARLERVEKDNATLRARLEEAMAEIARLQAAVCGALMSATTEARDLPVLSVPSQGVRLSGCSSCFVVYMLVYHPQCV
jgi:hypothetical protein